jgi:CubicO group peptidase (beta-lactamase class C family)
LPRTIESDKIGVLNAPASIVSPRLRRPFVVVLLLLAAASAYGGWRLYRLAPIGSAYAAKILCSGVFVAGRQPASVIAEDILADNTWLLRLVSAHVDRDSRGTSATFLGFARRDAQFRRGLGCTLAVGAGISPDPEVGVSPNPGPQQSPLPVSARAAGTDARALEAALDWAFAEPDPQRLRRTRAVVVVHRGEIVAERYAPGFTADTPLPGWSMTKTAAAALTGILIADQRLALDSRSLLSEWRDPGDGRAQIKLAHLLRMTDGLAFSEHYNDPLSDVVVMLLGTGDASGFALRKPLAATPGTSWRYSSGTTNVLAAVLRRSLVDKDLSGLVRHRLFERLGLDRLLPPGWVDYMRTPTPKSDRADFGAHLWLKVPQGVGGAGPAAAALPGDAFHLSGHEAQVVSVVPSLELVVVRLGLSRLPRTWDHAEFLARVLKAFPQP